MVVGRRRPVAVLLLTTTVVSVKSGEPYDVYIGRANARYGLARSPFANPYIIGRDGSRDDVIAKYRVYVQRCPDLLAAIPGLRGKVLGCWCADVTSLTLLDVPYICHGQVICAIADGVI